MRLKKVTMTGFKSFAERTALDLGKETLAIVGPNGCGKSNIVDALRWVMGESRASQLRQDTNADIIFNGANGRRPSDWCSVEMLLDNDGSRDIGMWGKYAQISVRRQVDRDGDSNYYVNGQRVRRRDVVDIFSGTGTGARSYGIVEQERVMQVVRSDPKRIRAHLEEAAGVSSYKERRRETENRLEVSRANLARIEDTIAELNRQLAALDRQAKLTERVRRLRKRLATARRLQMTMGLEVLQAAHDKAREDLAGAARVLNESKSKAEAAEAQLSASRKRANEHSEANNKVVGKHYAALAEHEKAKQGKLNFEESDAADKGALAEAEQASAEQEAKLVEVKAASEALEAELKEKVEGIGSIATKVAGVQAELDGARGALAKADERVQRAQAEVDRAAGAQSDATAQLQVTEYRMKDLRATLETAQKEMEALAPAEEPDREGLERLRSELDGARAAAVGNEERRREMQERISDAKEEVIRLQGEKGGLKAEIDLVMRIFERKSETHVKWLGERGLEDARRVVDMVGFEAPGLEKAVDAALEAQLDGYGVEDLGALLKDGSPPPGMVLVGRGDTDGGAARPAARDGLVPLLDKVSVKGEWALAASAWLSGVHLADGNERALAAMDAIGPGEIIVTADGACFHDGMVRVASDQVAGFGWKSRLEQLEARQAEVDGDIAKGEEELAGLKESRARLTEEGEALVARRRECEERFAELEQETIRREQAAAYHQEQLRKLKERAQKASSGLEEREREGESARGMAESAAKERQGLEESLKEAKALQAEASSSVAGLATKLGTVESESKSLETAREHLRARLGENKARLADLTVSLSKSKTRIVELMERIRKRDPKDLDRELADAEARVKEAAAALGDMEERGKEIESEQRSIEERLAGLRDELERVREGRQSLEVEAKKCEVEADGVRKQLDAMGADDGSAEELRKDHGDKESVDALAERLAASLERAGPVNEAVEVERTACESRLGEVNVQREDLAEAIASLQDAIDRIDREMLERLKAVHGKLNERFSALFQQLFDGGEASVELVGDSLLDAGLQIRATPPGKRVANIQALSGGEKTLTAVAFLFALNELTPPIFCVLDEVDAALDEANTRRFCRLVEAMANRTQFMIVTHNKTVIERADKLVGVTQEEKGISKLVAVNLHEALQQAKTVEEAAQA